jgi:hypothetical protein
MQLMWGRQTTETVLKRIYIGSLPLENEYNIRLEFLECWSWGGTDHSGRVV